MRETFEQLVARVNASAFVPSTKGESKMAKVVKLPKNREFSFKTTKGGAAEKYPWDEWLSGELLLLERSEGTENEKGTIDNITEKKDFEVSVNQMVPKVQIAARKRYKVVQISRHDVDGNKLHKALIIRARPMTDDERDAENERAEAERVKKEEAKARKAAPVVYSA